MSTPMYEYNPLIPSVSYNFVSRYILTLDILYQMQSVYPREIVRCKHV